MRSRGSHQIEINMTLAGAAVGAFIGLPNGIEWFLVGGLVGAAIPVPGLLFLSFLIAGIANLFFAGDAISEEESEEEKQSPP